LKGNPDADRRLLLSQVASAVEFLHTWTWMKGIIIHGDIRGENILISDDGSARLGDFSLTRIYHEVAAETKDYSMTVTSAKPGNSSRFKAPEVLLDDLAKSTQSDVYALGMVVFQIYAGVVPFKDMSDALVTFRVAAGALPQRPDSCPEDMWHIAKDCWAKAPRARPNIGAILRRMRGMDTAPSTASASGVIDALTQAWRYLSFLGRVTSFSAW